MKKQTDYGEMILKNCPAVGYGIFKHSFLVLESRLRLPLDCLPTESKESSLPWGLRLLKDMVS